jgi:hypothetical protein
MSVLSLFSLYFLWHYSRALRDLFGLWSNFLWFIGNLFSVSTLLRTLIQPLKLIEEDKGSFLTDPSEYAQSLLVNVIMRIVGTITRLTLIIIALALWLFLLVFGAAALILWLLLPPALILLILWGATLLL